LRGKIVLRTFFQEASEQEANLMCSDAIFNFRTVAAYGLDK